MNRRSAELAANERLKKYGVSRPEDIRLEDLAWDLNVEIVVGSLEGAGARIIESRGLGSMRIPKGCNQGQTRFRIGHELGHWHLHPKKLVSCQETDFFNWHSDGSVEMECNAFSSELLLPSFLLESRCDLTEVSFAPIHQIAKDFSASITASAIKFVQLCPEPCALVCSKAKDRTIEWVIRNRAFWGYTIWRGAKIDPRSLAARAFKNGREDERAEQMPTDVWLDDRRTTADSEIEEHILPMRRYNRALSLLWLADSEAPDKADDEEI